jgi:hypothetical protein
MALTENRNFLQPTGFKVVISRLEYPNLEFFAQSIQHPDVSITGPTTPYSRIGNVNLPGDALDYGELSIQFILDEDITSYTELYNWMLEMVNEKYEPQQTRSQTLSQNDPTQNDIIISVLTSNNTPSKRIIYKGCNPTSVTGLELNSVASTVEYLTFNASFSFTGFQFT